MADKSAESTGMILHKLLRMVDKLLSTDWVLDTALPERSFFHVRVVVRNRFKPRLISNFGSDNFISTVGWKNRSAS